MLCCRAHDLCNAAAALTNVAPLTEKGRADEADVATGGGGPPSVPVKRWMFVPLEEAEEEGAEEFVNGALTAAAVPESVLVDVLVDVLVNIAAATAAVPEAEEITALAGEDAELPATAALISWAVASGTRRFWVKMQPCSSSALSQDLPLPVASLRLPGAKVPAFTASCGSPPTEAICCARVSVMALLVAAALAEAGSCGEYIC